MLNLHHEKNRAWLYEPVKLYQSSLLRCCLARGFFLFSQQPLEIAHKYILPRFFSDGQRLSNWVCHTAGMKYTNRLTKPKTSCRVVASFGRASLVRIAGCNYELRGASEEDFTAAKEWVSFFLHEAVLCGGPKLHPDGRC
jgi:hypothetical protein